MMYNFIDITGQKFNKLTAIKHISKNGKTYWVCLCDCGRETIVEGSKLRGNHTKSCGCYRYKYISEASIQHGHNRRGQTSKTYHIWSGMTQRCKNTNLKCYERYGGRGIKVCERWNEFTNFLQDMGECPPNMSLDRIDNSGDYTPENCKWSTASEQARNTRRNHTFTFNGVNKPLVEWAERFNINYSTVQTRLNRGWSHEKALTTPIKSN